MTEFIQGQRYINTADLQLGLGKVLEQNQRMVKISFDAVDEQRIYAKETAPLNRYQAQIGDRLQHKDGWKITVENIEQLNGLSIYFGNTEDGREEVIPESEIADNISLDRPLDRLLNGQIDSHKWFSLRQQANQYQQQLQQSELYGLIGCRTELLPHQLYIAHQVAQRHAPRVLLADEVGLGKTIEACLIVHQQLLTNRAKRVLIIVPESLTHQWLVELLRRFNLQVSVMDEEKCVEIEASSGISNPFESAQLILLPLEMLLQNPLRQTQLNDSSWDLMVVDEAHHLVWQAEDHEPQNQSVQAYRLIEQLAAQIPGVLLLTATPEQLGKQSHFARLRLLDPNRYADFDQFIAEEKQFEPIADAIDQLIKQPNHTVTEIKKIAKILKPHISKELLQSLQQLPEQTAEQQPQTTTQIINQLLDQYGTGRVLFRNTRQSTTGFPERKLLSYPLPCPDIYQATTDALNPECQLPETELDWVNQDPRCQWLAKTIKTLLPEKLLLITASAQTAIQLSKFLREQHGIHAAVFHEGLDLIERDQAAAWFADNVNGASILLCSEIGSEGRNFQFAHHLILFDLPPHPDLLEQRIGRLDRIGQQQTIKIHVPYLEKTAQQRLFDWYHQALNLFNQTNPAAQSVFSNQQPKPQQAKNHQMPELIATAKTFSQQLLQQMEQGRNRLLEYNSCRPQQSQKWLKQAQEQQRVNTLKQFMHAAFEAYGVSYEEHDQSGNSEILRPGDQMHGFFPQLLEEGMTITYDRTTALSHENRHYITWEHPMVSELIEMIQSQEKGNSEFLALKNSGLKAGMIFLECNYLIQSKGQAELQLARYLPPISHRLLIAENGQDISHKLSLQTVQKLHLSVPRRSAIEVLKVKTAQIKTMAKQAEQQINQKLPTIINQAAQTLNQKINNEINRLENLSTHNAQVRPDEIQFFKAQSQLAEQKLHQTTPQLDSIRVLVTM